jgi:hypothetical protein
MGCAVRRRSLDCGGRMPNWSRGAGSYHFSRGAWRRGDNDRGCRKMCDLGGGNRYGYSGP